MSSTIENKKKLVLSKVTCPLCHDFLEHPKVLPTCKHVFCSSCIQKMNMTPTSDDVNAIVKVTCARCRAESELPNGNAELLKEDPAVVELFAKIKESHFIRTSYRYNNINWCLHKSLTPESELVKCLHCNGEFCEPCFKRHNDCLRKETAWAATGFESRLSKLAEKNYDKEARRTQVEEQLRIHEEEFLSNVAAFEQSFKEALDDYRKRSIAALRKIAEEEVPDFTLVTMLGDSIKGETTLELLSNKDLAEKHASVFEADQKIKKIEDSFSKPVSLPKIAAGSNNWFFEKMLKDLNSLTAEPVETAIPTEHEEHLKLAEALRLRMAAEHGDLDTVKSILERENLSPACRRYAANYYVGSAKYKGFDETPLMHAIKMGHLDVARYLVVEHHAHLDSIVYYTEALSYAAGHGYFDIVKFLIKTAKHDPSCLNFGVEPSNCETIIDSKLCVPLCKKRRFYLSDAILSAISNKHYEIAKCLLASLSENCETFDPDVLDDEHGITLLHQAVIAGNSEGVYFLVNVAGANIDAYSMYGMTPLHFATNGSQTIVEQLVDLGANPSLKSIPVSGSVTVKSQTAKQMADERRRMDISAYLAKCPKTKKPTVRAKNAAPIA